MIGQDKVAEQSYYDQLFRSRGRFDQFQNTIYEHAAAEARHGTSGTVALDVGCGSGTQSFCLIDQGFTVVAVDLSFEATKVTKSNAAKAGRLLSVINADVEFLPFADKSVDACICSLFLHHFETLEYVAAELRRVVRPGGVVIATDANAHNPFVWLFFNVIHRIHPLWWLTPNQRALRRSEIEQTFGRHGFGKFHFESFTTELRRDWLGNSLGFSLAYYGRAFLMRFSQWTLPGIARGNGLLSVMHRLQDS
jgi:ubiquinone/menaquinone biosynthesis C-methylase UbiE